jgi:hypothetical protein
MQAMLVAARSGSVRPADFLTYIIAASLDLRFGIFATAKDIEQSTLKRSSNLGQYEDQIAPFGAFLENSEVQKSYLDEVDALAALSESYAAGRRWRGEPVFGKEDLAFLKDQSETSWCGLPTMVVLAAAVPAALTRKNYQSLGFLLMQGGRPCSV